MGRNCGADQEVCGGSQREVNGEEQARSRKVVMDADITNVIKKTKDRLNIWK